MPVTIPVAEPMVAAVGRLLLHKPPATASLNAIVPPTHTTPGPAIAAGSGSTVSL